MIEWKKLESNKASLPGKQQREGYFINGMGPVVKAASFGWWLPDGTVQPAATIEEAKALAERAVWEL